MGRPPKSERERRDRLLVSRVNRAQHRKVAKAARKAGLSVSDFVWRAVQAEIESALEPVR